MSVRFTSCFYACKVHTKSLMWYFVNVLYEDTLSSTCFVKANKTVR